MKWNIAGLRNVAIAAAAVLVAACGGEEAPGDSNAGGTTPTAAPTVTITTTNSGTGQPSNALTLSSPLNATATVRDAKGAPVANAVVQFTASASSGGSGSSSTAFVTFSPASANGITDANGNVTVVVSAGSVSSSGAGTLSASASVGDASASSSAAIQVAQANISLQNLALNPATIAAFQTSTITVAVAGVPATTPVSVNFSSVCASAKKATITPTALTVNGTATANYSDNGCGQADTIIVSASGAPSVQGTLTIQPAAATNLVFVSANPDVIGIQGSGANTSSVVTFKVVDAGQQPVANAAVTMALDTVVGGVALENGLATQTKTTAADGTVTTQVVAGTQPTPVRVRASTASGLTAVSSNLTIQSGLPTQARFSLSVETFNIEGWNIDGTKTKVTIRAADRVGNPVPDNTVINFRSSGAALQPSCRTTGGACTVEFVSQANRPLTAPVGRITVLANASGLESFQDANGNNRYDMGEPFEDLGDAFVDNNFDRMWQAGEDFIPYNAAATAACATGLTSTPPPMKPMTCDGVWGGAQVRAQTQIILSGSNAQATMPASIALSPTGPAVTECSGGFTALIFDVNNNPMPAGTKIAVEASGVTAKVLNDTVVNTLAPNGTNHGITVTGSTCTGVKTGSVTLKVTTPGGLTTIFSPVIVNY